MLHSAVQDSWLKMQTFCCKSYYVVLTLHSSNCTLYNPLNVHYTENIANKTRFSTSKVPIVYQLSIWSTFNARAAEFQFQYHVTQELC
jgi:hypothetical protein